MLQQCFNEDARSRLPSITMRSFLAIFILASLVAIAVFGAFAMGHHGEGRACIAAAAAQTDCSTETNALASAIFHLKTFASFSAAVFGGIPFAAFILLAFAFIIAFGSMRSEWMPQLARALPLFHDGESPGGQWRLHSWLALFEKRDPGLS